jgi:hypothetical protein
LFDPQYTLSHPKISDTSKANMYDGAFNALRQLAAAADVPTFLQLVSSKACAALIEKKPGKDFSRLHRQGYSPLVLAALSKGLQLYTAEAAAIPVPWFCSKQTGRGPAPADEMGGDPGSSCDLQLWLL